MYRITIRATQEGVPRALVELMEDRISRGNVGDIFGD